MNENNNIAGIVGIKAGSTVHEVWRLVAPVCETEGIDLVYVELQSESGGKILRIYLDKPDGITLDDCTRVSRQVDDLLSVYMESLRDDCALEVSSAGLARPLARQQDFERFQGQKVRLKTLEAIDGRKSFTGVLRGLAGGMVLLEAGEEEFAVPFEGIKKAQLVC